MKLDTLRHSLSTNDPGEIAQYMAGVLGAAATSPQVAKWIADPAPQYCKPMCERGVVKCCEVCCAVCCCMCVVFVHSVFRFYLHGCVCTHVHKKKTHTHIHRENDSHKFKRFSLLFLFPNINEQLFPQLRCSLAGLLFASWWTIPLIVRLQRFVPLLCSSIGASISHPRIS